MNKKPAPTTPTTATAPSNNSARPLVALLDGRDCALEMPILKDIATVAFCDAQSTAEIHEKVLNEAVGALLYNMPLTRQDLMKFRSLKVVVKIGGGCVGHIDIPSATALGIAVCEIPAEAVEETADHTICLILSMFRRTFWVAKSVKEGKKVNNVEQMRTLMTGCRRVRGSSLGIVGLGRIGTAVAVRARALGFRVRFFDPNIPQGMDRALGGLDRSDSLADLLAHVDCVTLHCPLLPSTRQMLNAETLRPLKFGAFLVNTCAPDLLEPNAVLAALGTGHLKAAAFDFFLNPTERQNEIFEALCALPNVVHTPNCGWYSDESNRELRIAAANEVRRALLADGAQIAGSLANCVNKEDLLALMRGIAVVVNNEQKYTIPTSNGNLEISGSTASTPPLLHLNGIPAAASRFLNLDKIQSSSQIGQEDFPSSSIAWPTAATKVAHSSMLMQNNGNNSNCNMATAAALAAVSSSENSLQFYGHQQKYPSAERTTSLLKLGSQDQEQPIPLAATSSCDGLEKQQHCPAESKFSNSSGSRSSSSPPPHSRPLPSTILEPAAKNVKRELEQQEKETK